MNGNIKIMIKSLIKLMKINHYIKNAICFVPLIFSLKFLEVQSFIAEFLMFVSFCLISSSVYVLNDIFDAKADRLHKNKKFRPVASGKISIKTAILFMILLFTLSIFASLYINPLCSLIIVSYFILNIFYTLYFKHIEILDVVSIALGFVLRILAGCSAIMVPPSALVILLTFFVSMLFTFSKRKLEMKLLIEPARCRKSISKFTPELLNQFVLINAVLSISFYFTYVMDVHTIEKTGAQYLYISAIPFTLIIFRLLFLMNTEQKSDDPSDFIYKDKMLKILFLAYFIILMISFVI